MPDSRFASPYESRQVSPVGLISVATMYIRNGWRLEMRITDTNRMCDSLTAVFRCNEY